MAGAAPPVWPACDSGIMAEHAHPAAGEIHALHDTCITRASRILRAAGAVAMSWRFWSGWGKARLGAYQVERELGRGSMGVVYLGRDPASGREAAIKTVRLPAPAEDESWEASRARYLQTVAALIALDHPDIVKYYDAWEQDGALYVAMEFVEGAELGAFKPPERLLPLAAALEIAARVADALDYTHRHQLVHRDIKPANIMYNAATGMVKLVDFGISRPVNRGATRGGVVVGSPSYMSPEQILGGSMDGRSDLFSLGTTLYRLVSGCLPFEAGSEFEVMSRIVQDPHRDIASVRPGVPACVREVINRALQKKVEDRYQAGGEMAQALRQCLARLGGD